MTLVFQFGSNVDADRLNSPERLDRAARVVDLVRTVEPHELGFRVWSTVNQCAAADILPGQGRPIWGVLYDVPDELIRRETAGERRSFDAIESEGREYRRQPIRVVSAEGAPAETEAITYMVVSRRYDLCTALDYVRHILKGLLERGAPEDYLAYVRERIVANNPALGSSVDALLERPGERSA